MLKLYIFGVTTIFLISLIFLVSYLDGNYSLNQTSLAKFAEEKRNTQLELNFSRRKEKLEDYCRKYETIWKKKYANGRFIEMMPLELCFVRKFLTKAKTKKNQFCSLFTLVHLNVEAH